MSDQREIADRCTCEPHYGYVCAYCEGAEVRALRQQVAALTKRATEAELKLRLYANGASVNQPLVDDIDRWRVESQTAIDAAEAKVTALVTLQRENAEAMAMWAGRALKAEEQGAALTEREATWILARDRLMDERNKLIAECRALTEENARLREALLSARHYVEAYCGAKGFTAGMAEENLQRINAALSRLTAGETPKPRRSEMELDEALFCGAAGETPAKKPVVDALHDVFTRHGISSRSCFSVALIRELVQWAAKECRSVQRGQHDYKALYSELLFAVARNHPGEAVWHERALRYIQRAAGETPEPPAPTCTCDASGTDVAAAHNLDCRKAHTPPSTGAGEP